MATAALPQSEVLLESRTKADRRENRGPDRAFAREAGRADRCARGEAGGGYDADDSCAAAVGARRGAAAKQHVIQCPIIDRI